MTDSRSFTVEEARRIGEQVGIDWGAAPFDVEEFRRGLEVELERGLRDPSTNVTGDDRVVTPRSRSRTSTSSPTTTRASSG